MELKKKKKKGTKGALTVESLGCGILEGAKASLVSVTLVVDINPAALNNVLDNSAVLGCEAARGI